MINFMLPTLGAITLDGTWLITLGAVLVAGIVIKNRNNISIIGSESNINSDSNRNMNVEKDKVDIQSYDINDENTNVIEDEKIVIEEEKILN